MFECAKNQSSRFFGLHWCCILQDFVMLQMQNTNFGVSSQSVAAGTAAAERSLFSLLKPLSSLTRSGKQIPDPSGVPG